MVAPAAAAAAALSAVAEAALAAEFGKMHSGKRLRSVVAKALVAYLAGRGESLTEIGLDVDSDDVEGWKRTCVGKAQCEERESRRTATTSSSSVGRALGARVMRQEPDW